MKPGRPVGGAPGSAGFERTIRIVPATALPYDGVQEVTTMNETHPIPIASGPAEPTDDARWGAVLSRDPERDGAFVYAVRSTGIYCRPSCPSRRPRPDRVRFFATAWEAERAGFRACRRCRPEAAAAPATELAERARRWIEEHADEKITLARLGAALDVGPSHLQRTFTRVTGVSPRQYAESCRLARVKAHLREEEDVTTALYRAGYGSASRLYERTNDRLGMTPDAYRRRGAGTRIAYDIADGPLGRLLVAATERGVCAISLGSDDDALVASLTAEFPAARIERDEAAARPWVEALLGHPDGGAAPFGGAIDAGGTAFQRRVWDALRTIPYGETRTYGEVARQIGQPTAARAVARACAENRVAVVVPCHRVVRGDRGLGGYRWGIERKRALLARESRPAAGGVETAPGSATDDGRPRSAA